MSSLHGVNHASKLTVITAACAALAISAAGCGEKEEPATTGPVVTQSTTSTTTTTTTTKTPPNSSSPPLVIDAFLSSRDAENVCDELITPDFLRKEYGGRGACLASRKPGTLAKGDSRIVLADNRGRPLAHATARPKTGRYGGRQLAFTLLRQGRAWRINALVAK